MFGGGKRVSMLGDVGSCLVGEGFGYWSYDEGGSMRGSVMSVEVYGFGSSREYFFEMYLFN